MYIGSVQAQETAYYEFDDTVKDPIKELPSKLFQRYSTDIIPDIETANAYVEIIIKKRYVNSQIEELKPFETILIANDRVWYVKIRKHLNPKSQYFYHVKINKNTGEILNIWVDK